MQTPGSPDLLLLALTVILATVVLVVLLRKHLTRTEKEFGEPFEKEPELSADVSPDTLPETEDSTKVLRWLKEEKAQVRKDLDNDEFKGAAHKARHLLQVLDEHDDAETLLGPEKYRAVRDELDHMILMAEFNMRSQDVRRLSKKMLEIAHQDMDEWNQDVAEKELNEWLEKCYAVTDKLTDMLVNLGETHLADDLKEIRELVRLRVLEAREDMRKRTEAEREYYQRVTLLNQAILQVRSGLKSTEEGREIVRKTLENLEAYPVQPYFSKQLKRRAEKAKEEARDLLHSM